MKAKIEAVKSMIKRLGKDEQDSAVRQFFHILSQLLDKEYFINILTKILEKRSTITEEHLAYLIYISLQYLTGFSYDKKTRKNKLEDDFKKYSERIIKLCKTKYASTNVIERYALLQIILSILNRPCTVIDLGASIGLGLMSLNNDSFSNIKIDSKLKSYLKKKARITKAVGVDIQKPDLKWQLACYLPENKKDRIRVKKIYNKLRQKGTRINLLQGSILELNKIRLPKADVIWTSNTLYQIEGNVNEVVKNIQSLLKENGIWINADYRYDNKKFATPENPYIAMVRRKENWSRILEVLEAPSDVVRRLKTGRDFEEFKSAFE